jgi:hypothetical protein
MGENDSEERRPENGGQAGSQEDDTKDDQDEVAVQLLQASMT